MTDWKEASQAKQEDEAFLELVLQEQEKALEEERQQRLQGTQQQKKKRRTVRVTVWIIALVLLFNTFGLIFQIYSIPAIEFLKISSKLSLQEDIQTYKKAVVEISTHDSKGTGFAISEDGYILTNEHVIDDATRLTVVFPDHGIYEAEIIESFPSIDLAVLKVEGEELPYLKLADSYSSTAQEQVTFIGNPLYFTGIANEGTILESIQLEDWNEPVMMMKAPVYKGNSGSPVIASDGSVLGIVFATLKNEEHGKVGLFVPVEYFHQYASEDRP
ncbi:S1C family serine protease [Lysinibacillus sp. 54212]|uniref:S1C family serine protease n=1 Tax=Lysinibacillus sp. 54212 TaxID=3119829 RepID=UPI002FC741A6